ncbi:MAG: c-type cytochrome [Rhodobacter sp.]|nr:c-type cytochrome [Rhodobacter sp.]
MRAPIRSVAIAAIAVAAGCASEVETGRASYTDLCAGCHGAGGQGNGPGARGLTVPPSDLTLIAAQNAGTFPRVEVMAKIDGYAKGEPHHGAMPVFWPLLEGRMVLVPTGDGILTPTPEPLVALAAYLESIQRQPRAAPVLSLKQVGPQ